VRNTWLTVHIVLVNAGYAALLFTAVASVVYPFPGARAEDQEAAQVLLPATPLGTLDDLISKTWPWLRAHHSGRRGRVARGPSSN